MSKFGRAFRINCFCWHYVEIALFMYCHTVGNTYYRAKVRRKTVIAKFFLVFLPPLCGIACVVVARQLCRQSATECLVIAMLLHCNSYAFTLQSLCFYIVIAMLLRRTASVTPEFKRNSESRN